MDRPWHRPLESGRDRLVLITGYYAPKTIRVVLRTVLRRARELRADNPLELAASNQQEESALGAFLSHVQSYWHRVAGTRPTQAEIRAFIELFRIHSLEIEDGGSEELGAMEILRRGVLSNPDDATLAWRSLLVASLGYARSASGADRNGLQHVLAQGGLNLLSPPSYRSDTRSLAAYTDATLNLLQDHSVIKIGSTSIRINRSVVAELVAKATEGSILVVGEPGAGKSGVLYELVKKIRARDQEVVLLAADRLGGIRSRGDLQRELGLEHDTASVFQNWLGLDPAFIVIDALDAARAEEAARTIRDLIFAVLEAGTRWRVVASVRKFDLRYNRQLQRLFRGVGATTFRDNEFANVRHLNVPRLTRNELKQLGDASSDLEEVIANAPFKLGELLTVPFNIRLVAELLDSGVAVDLITPIRTQLDLLERYWSARVIEEGEGSDSREGVLLRTCTQMLGKRTLQVDRLSVLNGVSENALGRLLSNQVLVEWSPTGAVTPQRHLLAFSHHVLFDYSVARLILRLQPDELAQKLSDDPELVIVARPSIVLHYEYLWQLDSDHARFWQTALRLSKADGIPATGQLIGPSVGARLAGDIDDIRPLVAALDSPQTSLQNAAEKTLRHFIGSALTEGVGAAAENAGSTALWTALLEHLSQSFREPIAYSARPLLHDLCERVEDLRDRELGQVGLAARRLLEWAWEQSPRDKHLVVQALTAVLKTFATDTSASAALIRRAIAPEHLASFGFEEMPWIARGTKYVVRADANLAADVYRAAFAHEETSHEATSLSGSQIIPLTSNRSQDYRHSHYELAQQYPLFLRQAPLHATRAAIAVMASYVKQRHRPVTDSAFVDRPFRLGKREASIRRDHSCVWDSGDTYRHDDALKILDALFDYLEELVKCSDLDVLDEILQTITHEGHLAVFWRRLLLLGSRFPEVMGQRLSTLAQSTPILEEIDTSTAAGAFLKAAFSMLDFQDRQLIEEAVMRLPQQAPTPRDEEYLESVRDRLLGCLSEGELVTEAARLRLEALQQAEAVPENEPPFEFSEISSMPYGEVEFLAGEGVAVAEASNRRMRDLEAPVKEFAQQHQNAAPNSAEIADALPNIEALWNFIREADDAGVDPRQRNYAWGTLAEACSDITSTEKLDCNDRAGQLIRSILLVARGHTQPEPEHDSSQFDEAPSWGKPAARIDAAAGLTTLGRHRRCFSAEILDAVAQLLHDPVPAVRFQVAARLNALAKTAPDAMWQLIEETTASEESAGVLQGLLGGPLARLAGSEPERITRLGGNLLKRAVSGPGWDRVREQCVHLLANLYVWRNVQGCRQILMQYANNPQSFPEEANDVLDTLREPLTYGDSNSPEPTKDAVRSRAFSIFEVIVLSAVTAAKSLKASQPERFEEWPSAARDRLQGLYRIINHAGSELYFASGAYGEQTKAEIDSTIHKQRFYREAAPILEVLAQVGLPGTTHHLLETLQFLIDIDPEGVFLRIEAVVRAAESWGYQYESLAVSLVVDIVERYLAEHRDIFRGSDDCRRALIRILDVFVEAGWPAARQLTYRLDEIFR